MFVKKVPKDFSGHDEDLGIGLELDVACHNADSVFWELFFEIRELLIGQGFDGICGKDPFPFAQSFIDGDLSDGGLP